MNTAERLNPPDLCEEDRLGTVAMKLVEAIGSSCNDMIIAHARRCVIEDANNDPDTCNAILDALIVDPVEAKRLRVEQLEMHANNYADRHFSILLDYFRMTDDDRAYDAALDRGEVPK